MHIPSNKLNGTGLRRIVKATECSFKGFKAAWLYESAFRQELVLCAVLLPCSLVLKQSALHWLALIMSLLFLLFAEIINSALEALADSVSLEHHPLIGRAKDMGSAGVFIAMAMVGLLWTEALWRYLA
ncbi:diacylglycerol kinase [Paraglaciecola polaris]|uniref:Diacylglycerol kinase n=1 Tax=Paraglaciecola polaris LMG 21857 TaxID=1129793 RepID=K6YML7_9ALTE|nr:diacylglycerol kinase [Paraglaciecola polaris]GAC33929.1 diacylglycerol kinase [Paraglaciecola polaris LMG 21857]|tara:strand:- start:521 stop:904 length:384 start_codon:yes stop_codon:yes gene_type:complete